jgi:eukaryotic-like serine/threonine-protein kinase
VTSDERWRRIEEICHDALERLPGERSAYVGATCAGDESLRMEVESLLANQSRAAALGLETGIRDLGLGISTDELIGKQIGVYKIVSLLGAGGMGEVYRAHDMKLQRDVAIKVLPGAFTADRDRLSRFQREARVLAALNHPHIGAIYGFEDASSVTALVLELVDGETLADRLARGPLPIEQALAMARQIADALDAAHELGIVHRDLKPGNIQITRDGAVKVLDFGLAKVVTGGRAGNNCPESPDATIDRTGAGMMLGTPSYMSPEQARGQPVDKRADIWAFGCVLYEMLTGRVAFAGETTSDTIAAILEREPNWSALPETIPAGVHRLLLRCLDKDPKRRLRDIGDARVEIETTSDALVRSPSTGAHRRVILIAACAVSVAIALTAAVMKFVRTDDHAAHSVTRLTIPLADSDVFTAGGGPRAAVSRDGKRVVYVANRRLYLRTLEQLEAVPILGTEPPPVFGQGRNLGFAENPFFSPDGQWVGFTQGDEIKKVPATGGVATRVSALTQAEGYTLYPHGPIAWSADDTMLFASTSLEGRNGGIWRVPAGGGTPKLAIALGGGQVATAPQLLPGETEILFTVSTGASWDDAAVVVQSLSTTERHVVVQQAFGGRYVAGGYLIYGFHGTLYGVQLDLAAHRIIGTPGPLVSGVAQMTAMPRWGAFQYWLSNDGTLVYLPEASQGRKSLLVWVDRQGREQPLPAEPRAYQYPRISPDGQRVALDLRDQQNDVWLWDFARSTLTRLTFGRQSGGPAIWSPDGQHVVFGPDRGGILNLFWQSANGTGFAERLLTSPNVQYGDTFSPDGSQLVFDEVDPKTKYDLRVRSMNGGHVSTPLLQTPFNEQSADLSPDGHWMAYQSDESGRAEVYVRPYPDVNAGRWQISTSGGTRPLWSRDGRELFYLDAERRMTVVAVQAQSNFSVGLPTMLFDTRSLSLAGIGRNFDVSPDGTRFLMVKDLPVPAEAKRLIVVQNWFEDLKRLVPVK